jgi:ABC-2 type transport system permease protein
MGFTLVAGVLTAPALVLAVVAVVSGAAVWSWLALVAGLFIGVGVAVGGVVLGGRVFDRSGPLLLERVHATSGY